jgi:Tfp pilus assembly protein PilV
LLGRPLKNEAGYSLVEVMVSIMLLTITIIPMVGMFNAGLRAAVLGSNYDQARTLANEKLEEIRALPYKSSDPSGAGTANSVVKKFTPPGPAAKTEGIFAYTVRTKFVDANFANPADSPATSQMRVEVTVSWDENKSYTTTGYVAGG